MFLFYVYVQGPACVYCLVPAEARRRHGYPELKLQVVMGYLASLGNRT